MDENSWIYEFEQLRNRKWMMQQGKYYEIPFINSPMRTTPYRIGFPLHDEEVFVLHLNHFLIDFEPNELGKVKEFCDKTKGTVILHNENNIAINRECCRFFSNEGWTSIQGKEESFFLYGRKAIFYVSLFKEIQSLDTIFSSLPFEYQSKMSVSLSERIWHKFRKQNPHASVYLRLRGLSSNRIKKIKLYFRFIENEWVLKDPIEESFSLTLHQLKHHSNTIIHYIKHQELKIDYPEICLVM